MFHVYLKLFKLNKRIHLVTAEILLVIELTNINRVFQ